MAKQRETRGADRPKDDRLEVARRAHRAAEREIVRLRARLKTQGER